MAEKTVIDELIVKLGLDPKDFKKGVIVLVQETKNAERQVRDSSRGMGAEFTSLAKRYLAAGAILGGIKKWAEWSSDLAESIHQLSIDARGLGMAANELRNFQNVGERMGSTTQNVTKSIEGITKAVYDLAYNGQISDSLVMLGRLGVQFQDTAGNMLGFEEIAMNAQQAVQDRMQSGMLTRVNANQMLLQAGFDPGLSRAMLDGTLGDLLQMQRQKRQVSEQDTTLYGRWQETAIDRSQSLDAAKLNDPTMQAQARAGTAINIQIAEAADSVGQAKSLQEAADGIRAAVPLYDAAINATSDAMTWAANILTAAGQSITQTGQTPGPNNFGNLKDTKGNFRSFRTREDGVRANADQLQRYLARGVNTADKIVDTWAPPGKDNPHNENYKQLIEQVTGMDRNAVLSASDLPLLMEAMFRFEKGANAGTPDSGEIADILQNAAPTPAARIGGGSETNIDIDQITIQTHATDADGIAREIPSAIRRKTWAGMAERGQD